MNKHSIQQIAITTALSAAFGALTLVAAPAHAGLLGGGGIGGGLNGNFGGSLSGTLARPALPSLPKPDGSRLQPTLDKAGGTATDIKDGAANRVTGVKGGVEDKMGGAKDKGQVLLNAANGQTAGSALGSAEGSATGSATGAATGSTGATGKPDKLAGQVPGDNNAAARTIGGSLTGGGSGSASASSKGATADGKLVVGKSQ
jgi:hypothetical protein